jgi:hypothetical protein
MKPKKMVWIGVILAICIGLGLFVAPAEARNIDNAPASIGGEKLTGELQISVQHVGHAYASTTIVLYDKEWKAVDEVSTRQSGHRFAELETGGYHVVAYSDDIGAQASADAEVQSDKTAVVALKLETQSALKPYANYGSCSGGVSGDGNILKISASYGAEVIYMQCGRVVAVYGGGASCSCGGGNWTYVNKCEKPKPIYVNLPCPRGRNN